MTAVKHQQMDWLASLQSLLGTVVIAVFVITFVVQAFQIPSESMENTLLIGDYLLVNKLRYGGTGGIWDHVMPYRQIKRGDIIVFLYPVNPTQHFVKRVVAVPGDRLRLVNRVVYVNGTPLKEPYVRHNLPQHDTFRDEFPRLFQAPDVTSKWSLQMHKFVEDGQLIIPEGCYFALGDNRDERLDSRYWGFVPRENIIGTPWLIYWSVRDTQDEMPVAAAPGDKLYHFAYAITHLFQITRWDRTFHLVK